MSPDLAELCKRLRSHDKENAVWEDVLDDCSMAADEIERLEKLWASYDRAVREANNRALAAEAALRAKS